MKTDNVIMLSSIVLNLESFTTPWTFALLLSLFLKYNEANSSQILKSLSILVPTALKQCCKKQLFCANNILWKEDY